MNPKVCLLCYLPPRSFGNTTFFHQNVTSFKTRYPLVWYSDDHSWPDVVPLKGSPEFMKGSLYPGTGNPNPWAVPNIVFWTGVAIAIDQGYTHVLCLEPDCRVAGDEWDRVIVDEFLEAGEGKLVGGSAITYSPCNRVVDGDPAAGRRFARRWQKFLFQYGYGKFPIPSFGGGGSAEKYEQVVMVNGALGVYDLAFLKSIGPAAREKTAEFCAQTPAWDYYIGRKLVEKYAEDAFDRVVHLDSIYSGYGNVLFNEQDRIKLLTDGDVVAVHQVKSNWTLVGSVAETADAGSAGTSAHGSSGSDHNHKSAVATNAGSNPAIAPTFETPDGGNRPSVVFAARASSPNDAITDANEAPTASAVSADAAPAESGASSSVVNPRVSLFIVTHARDIEYLKYCLKSIEKFATGFSRITIVCPDTDDFAIGGECGPLAENVVLRTFVQAPEPLGQIHHQFIKCCADLFDTEADYFAWIDSDCIFTEPVTPADYFVDGKPVALMESYASLRRKDDGAMVWQKEVSEALGWSSKNEFMRRHPAVHSRQLLSDLRKHMEDVHKKPMQDFVLSRKPKFPQGFCEFNTMGEFAWHLRRTSYHWINLEKHPMPANKLLQFWSHGPIDKPQDINNGGVSMKGVVPIVEIKRILGLNEQA